ncbi:MAG: hypothetical protein KatS3mg109_1340 [Pirellulaceae bacterium]|nr:MAG: hypothetical protein KatS3mg109_0393 [Pirellulaceae bacterium]GIW90770.1 MAG: hypothetical protein KatS3mg109_1202 [Pirellulaceae bacterium]GIW90908.1 MAG: hypothetical protein KatS3mg109_1340 [Pirellulaceae bacterium]
MARTAALKKVVEPESTVSLTIKPLRVSRLAVEIHNCIGSPLVLHRFSQKMREKMLATMIAGSTARSSRKRESKNLEEEFNQARYISAEGWDGIPAGAFRAAMVSACRAAGYKMTHAKLAVWIRPDGEDQYDGTPLVRIVEGAPEPWVAPVRVQQSADIHVRPMWKRWAARLTIEFDRDLLSSSDVLNLLSRAGLQVGIGEGRPDSRSSTGLGFGRFEINPENVVLIEEGQ